MNYKRDGSANSLTSKIIWPLAGTAYAIQLQLHLSKLPICSTNAIIFYPIPPSLRGNINILAGISSILCLFNSCLQKQHSNIN